MCVCVCVGGGGGGGGLLLMPSGLSHKNYSADSHCLSHSILIPRHFTSRYYGDNGEEIVMKVSSNCVCSLLLHSQECIRKGSCLSCWCRV